MKTMMRTTVVCCLMNVQHSSTHGMPELTSLASNLGIAEPHRILAYGRVADLDADSCAKLCSERDG